MKKTVSHDGDQLLNPLRSVMLGAEGGEKFRGTSTGGYRGAVETFITFAYYPRTRQPGDGVPEKGRESKGQAQGGTAKEKKVRG